MRILGKKRVEVLTSIEAYAACSPSTGCDSDVLCACACRENKKNGGYTVRNVSLQTTNCKIENSAYWSNYIKKNGNYSPYNYSCKR